MWIWVGMLLYLLSIKSYQTSCMCQFLNSWTSLLSGTSINEGCMGVYQCTLMSDFTGMNTQGKHSFSVYRDLPCTGPFLNECSNSPILWTSILWSLLGKKVLWIYLLNLTFWRLKSIIYSSKSSVLFWPRIGKWQCLPG